MKSNPFQDNKASSLLDRVRDDLSRLRDDVGTLLSHTTKRTLPNGARKIADQARSGAREFADHARSGALDFAGHARSSARELADQAKSQLDAGGSYAFSRLRDFRGRPARSHSAGWVGGAVVVGLLAYGAYALYRQNCAAAIEEEDVADEAADV